MKETNYLKLKEVDAANNQNGTFNTDLYIDENLEKLDSAMKASDERVDSLEMKQNDLETNQGNLGALQTVNKSNLVNAMNEVF